MKGHSRTNPVELRRLVSEKDMTLKRLAVAAGLSYSFVRYVAAGRRQLSDGTALKIARVLGVDASVFFDTGEALRKSA